VADANNDGSGHAARLSRQLRAKTVDKYPLVVKLGGTEEVP
jgi:hypothetical protein